MTKPRVLFPLLFVVLLAARLCHSGILWAEETLPLAAAQQMRLGRVLYRDIWFDKPPLLALAHLPFTYGWPLRVAGATKVAQGSTTLDEVLSATPAWE